METMTGRWPELEHKAAATLDARPGRPAAGAATVDPDTGEVTALAAVTGSRDEVGDVIVPGALGRALQRRTPRLCNAHDWARPAGRVVEARELMPGDPRLPRTAPDGAPWPREAGALWFKARFLPTREGQEARAVAQAFGPDGAAYSIGYKVTDGGAKIRNGTRYITDLDVFEVSAVLHGASRLATLLDVKAAPAGREVKATTGGSRIRTVLSPTRCMICGGPAPGGVDGRSPESGLVCSVCMGELDNLTDELTPDNVHAEPGPGDLHDGRRALAEPVTCALCGLVAGGAMDRLDADREVICAGCVAAVISLGDRLADGADTDPGSDAEYAQALRDEKPLMMQADGTLVRDPGT